MHSAIAAWCLYFCPGHGPSKAHAHANPDTHTHTQRHKHTHTHTHTDTHTHTRTRGHTHSSTHITGSSRASGVTLGVRERARRHNVAGLLHGWPCSRPGGMFVPCFPGGQDRPRHPMHAARAVGNGTCGIRAHARRPIGSAAMVESGSEESANRHGGICWAIGYCSVVLVFSPWPRAQQCARARPPRHTHTPTHTRTRTHTHTRTRGHTHSSTHSTGSNRASGVTLGVRERARIHNVAGLLQGWSCSRPGGMFFPCFPGEGGGGGGAGKIARGIRCTRPGQLGTVPVGFEPTQGDPIGLAAMVDSAIEASGNRHAGIFCAIACCSVVLGFLPWPRAQQCARARPPRHTHTDTHTHTHTHTLARTVLGAVGRRG